MLDHNPITWLEGRELIQHRILWLLVLNTTGYWLVRHLLSPRTWPDEDIVVLWPMFIHYPLCVWIAVDAPRRLSDDRQSGALELLLCTPLPPHKILKGNLQALRRRFLAPFLFLIVFYTYSALACMARLHAQGRPLRELLMIATFGGCVLPLQGYALGRLAVHQALIQKSSLRATFMAGWKIGVLPWVLFVVIVFFLANRRTRVPDEVLFGTWALAHVITNGFFLILARRKDAKLQTWRGIP